MQGYGAAWDRKNRGPKRGTQQQRRASTEAEAVCGVVPSQRRGSGVRGLVGIGSITSTDGHGHSWDGPGMMWDDLG